MTWCIRAAFGLLAASSLLEGTGARDTTLLTPGAVEALDFLRLQGDRIVSNTGTSLLTLLLGQVVVWTAHYGMLRAALADHAPRLSHGGTVGPFAAFVAGRALSRVVQLGLVLAAARAAWSLHGGSPGRPTIEFLLPTALALALAALIGWVVAGLADHLALRLQTPSGDRARGAQFGAAWIRSRCIAAVPAIGGMLALLSVSGQTACGIPAASLSGVLIVGTVGAVGLALCVAGDAWWLAQLVQLVPEHRRR